MSPLDFLKKKGIEANLDSELTIDANLLSELMGEYTRDKLKIVGNVFNIPLSTLETWLDKCQEKEEG